MAEVTNGIFNMCDRIGAKRGSDLMTTILNCETKLRQLTWIKFVLTSSGVLGLWVFVEKFFKSIDMSDLKHRNKNKRPFLYRSHVSVCMSRIEACKRSQGAKALGPFAPGTIFGAVNASQ